VAAGAVRSFAWFHRKLDRIARERARITEADVREAILAQEEEMANATAAATADETCIVCGSPGEPTPRAGGGLAWSVAVCQPCANRLAAKALRKITKRFLREQID